MSEMRGCGARQRGIGVLNLILIVALISFFMTLLLKLGPAYLNYWTIRSIMNDVAEQSESIEAESGARGISSSLGRRMNINNVSDLSVKDFVIKKIDEKLYSAELEYEDRRHLFFNVDAILMFDYQVEVKVQ